MYIQPFHLAIPVNDLVVTRRFYGGLLGFGEGRSNPNWIDWNFFGHQLVTHLDPRSDKRTTTTLNIVDGKDVPIPHFGVVLRWDLWHDFADKLKAQKVEFIIEPYIRFKNKTGEQATMFFLDPSHNALEFKSFRDPYQLFAK